MELKEPRRSTRTTQGIDNSNIALKSVSRHMVPKMEQRSSPVLDEDNEESETEADQAERSFSDDDFNNHVIFNMEVSKALAEGGSRRTVVSQQDDRGSQGSPTWMRIVLGAMILTLLAAAASYKMQSAPIGYCYPGTDTNAILGERKAARIAAQECTERLAQAGDVDSSSITCTPLPFLPLPEPMACAPCPAHAYCTPDTVTCEPSFVLRQSPLAMIPLFPQLFDGTPGLGPVAFPPICVEDEERKRNIGRLGVALENYLALTRGHRLCVGVPGAVGDGGEAAQLGLDVDRVHDHLKKITVVQVCCALFYACAEI